MSTFFFAASALGFVLCSSLLGVANVERVQLTPFACPQLELHWLRRGPLRQLRDDRATLECLLCRCRSTFLYCSEFFFISCFIATFLASASCSCWSSLVSTLRVAFEAGIL